MFSVPLAIPGCRSLRRFFTFLLFGAGMGAAAQPLDQPPPAPLLPVSALAEYEQNLDHAALIAGGDARALARGREIYQQACHSCHGDLSFAGSLPGALRFGEGGFLHGKDPYTMYQTLTRGWRMMMPQVQLVPQEKYDVIHYIREHYLKAHNPSQYFEVTSAYLESLPKGSTSGPAPVRREPWREMDYGNFLIGTFEIMTPGRRSAGVPEGSPPDYIAPGANLAYKAVAIRLDRGKGGVSRGNAWLAFEHDTLRMAGVWSGDGFIDWRGINFDGRHAVRPGTIGDVLAETADAPGWANPETGDFADLRLRGLDGRPYGPLPRPWGRYLGLYRHAERTVVAYRVGDANVLESHDGVSLTPLVVTRTLNIGKSSRDLALRVGNAGTPFHVRGEARFSQGTEDGFEVIRIPATATPVNLAIVYGALSAGTGPSLDEPVDLYRFTHGGPSQWPDTMTTPLMRGDDHGPFAVDRFTLPARSENPSRSWMRTSGHDFIAAGDALVICTWDGDVWRMDGIRSDQDTVTWRKIASGLFQPLGIKVVNGDVLVSCRDQIVRLRDLNGDGETDFYECFNSDHQVTDHFHEFAMGLQADAEGNLYYAKSARHARTALVPHHGTVLKVSADGARTEILANGFRAANGVCLNPDGSLIVTDQEGHWMPMNRINWIPRGQAGFYGNMWSYGAPSDRADSAMEPPLAWVGKSFDRSPAELLWIQSEDWGPLEGKLLNLSYGTGRIEIVPHEFVEGKAQGGVSTLPIPEFPTGVMRGRFHPEDGHLYVSGLSAWATNKMDEPGGVYRIRATGKPVHVPIGLNAHQEGIDLTFSAPLDAETSMGAGNYTVTTWSLVRSERYGSPRTNLKVLPVTQVHLSADRRTVRLTIPEITPVQQMEIRYAIKGANGTVVEGSLQNTIHALGETPRRALTQPVPY